MELDYFLMFISGKQLFFLAWEMLFAFRARAHTHTHVIKMLLEKKSNIVHNLPKRRHTKGRARIQAMRLLTE